MTITMQELADYCGVTKMTVSRALRSSGSVKIDTREQILEAARYFNYVPRFVSPGRIGGKIYNIVYFTFDPESDQRLSEELLVRHLGGCFNAAKQHNCNLSICYFNEKQTYDEIEENLFSHACSGIFFSTNFPSDIKLNFIPEDFIKAAGKRGIPCVTVNASSPILCGNTVLKDDIYGAYIATKYLLESGHRRIAFITREPVNYRGYEERFRGYRQALEEFNIGFAPELCVKAAGFGMIIDCFDAIDALLALEESPTAIVAVNDLTAIETMKVLGQRNIKIPEDISIIGYDNIGESKFTNPKLTSVNTRIPDERFKAYRISACEDRAITCYS